MAPLCQADILEFVVLGVVISIKAALLLVCLYVAKQTGSDSVKTYAQDHRNDVGTSKFCDRTVAHWQ